MGKGGTITFFFLGLFGGGVLDSWGTAFFSFDLAGNFSLVATFLDVVLSYSSPLLLDVDSNPKILDSSLSIGA